MRWLVWSALAGALVALVAAALSALGTRRWTAAARALNDELEAQRVAPSPGRYDVRELDALPGPVQRYFRAVLTPGQAMVSAVTIGHEGMFNMTASGEQWKPFTSIQRVVLRRPGFLWDARIAIVPGLAVRVHDSYVGGRGLLHAALQGLFSVADVQGGGELARGELMRWFAEAAWYPTALLPSQGVRWDAVDDRSAYATLVDGEVSLTLLFRFDDAGRMASLRAEARGRGVGQELTLAPWEGRWSNHQLRDGMTVPLTGEVAWLLPEGRKTYWRGTISALRYEWAP
jgi:hypothetical protein